MRTIVSIWRGNNPIVLLLLGKTQGFREKLHGHNYQVAISITGKVGDDGYVIDVHDIKEVNTYHSISSATTLHFTIEHKFTCVFVGF